MVIYSYLGLGLKEARLGLLKMEQRKRMMPEADLVTNGNNNSSGYWICAVSISKFQTKAKQMKERLNGNSREKLNVGCFSIHVLGRVG